MLQHVGDNSEQFTTQYGNVSAASIGAIQRGLLTLESQGADRFFGEPMLNVADLMQTDAGRGVVNVLAADQLMSSPQLYAMILLWLLSEIFELLPEIGDPEKPRLVFFFDEAHLLFTDAPKVLLDKVEQVVRLVRSKGVGVFFVTQNPLDVPDTVLGQLGNRVQHALHAFTPREQKAVRAVAETMRANPGLYDRAGHRRARRRRGARLAARRARPARRSPSARSWFRPAAASALSRRTSARSSSPRRRLPAATSSRSTASPPTSGSRRASRRPAPSAPSGHEPPRHGTAASATGPARRARQPRVRHLVRPPRAARRATVGRARRGAREERRAFGRIADGPRADPRRARVIARRR